MCGGQGWPERATRALGAEVQVAEAVRGQVLSLLSLHSQPLAGSRGLELSSLVQSCLDSLASRHFPGLLGGQPLDFLCTGGDWHLPGLALHGHLFFLFFCPSESFKDARMWEQCRYGLALFCKENFSSHFPFNSESIQISIKSLKRFPWTLKGIEISSAGTLVIVIWSIRERSLKWASQCHCSNGSLLASPSLSSAG